MKIRKIKIILFIALVFTIALINISGCGRQAEQPEDLTARLYWDTGTLPPEYYYYYRITIGPGCNGTFEYQPGYGEPPAPDTWKTDFAVSAEQLANLYQLLIVNNVFNENWGKGEVAEGGSFSSITITAGGKEYKIPGGSALKKADRSKIDRVSDYIKEMVPADIWEEMDDRQSLFEESFTYE